MVDEIPDPTCAVCGRRLLPGERAIAFVTRDGETIEVCERCKPRADAAGWLTPEEAEAAGGATAGRERRRSRGAQVLGGLLARRPQPETDGGPPEPSAARGAAAAEPPPAEPDADPDPVDAPEPVPTGTTVAEALRAFNRSDHRRTVAGLTRTLGPPRATALVVKGNGSGDTVRLTIAWEITWYQWEVAASGRGHEVRESGKGETIDQLRAPDRAWNLMAAADGTLEEKTASATPVEEA
jgi:predicted RNA-binding Zn-ribbon protein involved in translation (DUF1610 family)